MWSSNQLKVRWHRIRYWEYWPFGLVYFPVFFLWLYYSIRARTPFFFNASNPGFPNGGFIMDSKKHIYDLIPQQHYPETHFIKAGAGAAELEKLMASKAASFPLILKPDVGLRGHAVRKINSLSEWRAYHAKAKFDYLCQDFIEYPNEIGVFYVRYPDQAHGSITGIVAKEFVDVVGNGVDSIERLLQKEPRFAMHLDTLKLQWGERLNDVLALGAIFRAVPLGNHCRGAKFVDASAQISPALTQVIDQICRQVPGFYFGRLDLMYRDWESLERGEAFSIIELNGAASEPTHIYDPSHSIWFGWKELFRHIGMMYAIARKNQSNGHAFLNWQTGMEQYRLHRAEVRKFSVF